MNWGRSITASYLSAGMEFQNGTLSASPAFKQGKSLLLSCFQSGRFIFTQRTWTDRWHRPVELLGDHSLKPEFVAVLEQKSPVREGLHLPKEAQARLGAETVQVPFTLR